MPELISLDSISGAFSFCVDFYSGRAAVRANTKLLPAGVPLEKIPEGSNYFAPGIVLMTVEWDVIYFVNIRPGWRIDEYFQLADELLRKPRRKRT